MNFYTLHGCTLHIPGTMVWSQHAQLVLVQLLGQGVEPQNAGPYTLAYVNHSDLIVVEQSICCDMIWQHLDLRQPGRLPTLSWCNGSNFASLWRCAQPMEGLLGQGTMNMAWHLVGFPLLFLGLLALDNDLPTQSSQLHAFISSIPPRK